MRNYQPTRPGLADTPNPWAQRNFEDISASFYSVKNDLTQIFGQLGGTGISTKAVITNPSFTDRNLIQPLGVGVNGVVLKAPTGSPTSKAWEVRSSADVVQAAIDWTGVISSATWNGVVVGVAYGGTGLSSYTIGDTLYASGATTLAKLGIGSANKILGSNSGATAPEYKAVTVTLAGAVANATTIDCSGRITTTAGHVNVADSFGMNSTISGTDRSMIGRSGTTLEVGQNAGWTGMNLRIASGDFYFYIGADNYLNFSTTAFNIGANTLVSGTFRATGAGTFDTTLSAGATTVTTLTTSGRVGIGGAIVAADTVIITGALGTGADQNGLVVDVSTTVGTPPTGTIRGIYSRISATASGGTTLNCNVIEAAVPVIGASSAITNLRGVYVNAMTGATNNTGIWIEDITGGTLNYAIYTNAGGVRFGGALTLNTLTASLPVFTDASKGLVSNTMTGTGDVMMSANPVTTGTFTGAISNWSGAMALTSTLTVSGTANSQVVFGNITEAAFQTNEILTVSGGVIRTVRYGSASSLNIFRANGTFGSASAVLTGEIVGGTNFFGYGASQYTAATASIYAAATENFTNTAMGTRVIIAVTPNSSTTQATEMTIAATGVSIAHTLTVSGNTDLQSAVTSAGAITFTGTTDSTSVSTGILIVSGGVGIAKALYAAGDCHIVRSNSGGKVQLNVENTDSASGSGAFLRLAVNGTSAGTADPYIHFFNSGIREYAFGMDVTASGQPLVWSHSSTLGSSDLMTLNSSGNLTLTGTALITGVLTLSAVPRFNGTNTTGAGTPLFGTNSPAVTNTNPYTWFQVTTSDGSTGYIPVWK